MSAEATELPEVRRASQVREASTCAPQPISNVAAAIGQSLYYEILNGVLPPKKHKIVPEVSVTLSYRFEPVESP